MIGKAIDNLISVFSPAWGAKRMAYRNQILASSGVHRSMEKLLGGRNAGGYEAGKVDRLKGRTVGSAHENDVPRQQIANLRYRSWNLFRNNPQARKICRTLGAKVIGRGLSPQPQATDTDGRPFVDFRKRAREVWQEFNGECDFRGRPGCGGHHLVTLAKTALRQCILSGGTLYRFHHLGTEEQKELSLFLPLQIQLIHIDRLDEEKHGDKFYRGLELDKEARVIAYHILEGGTGDGEGSVPVPKSEMRHLFAEEDIDQLIGSPWMGASMLTMDDRRSYESSEIIAAESASCYIGTYKRSPGQTGAPGLQQDGDRDLNDADGNPITHLQPNMLIDLGSTGEFNIVSASRPNSSAEPFLQHLVRSEAVSVPGVKASTLTGDYRNSSFSSERSADNDVWPELEELQDWFATGFSQPIYDEVITVAVAAGKFDGIDGFSVEDFNTRKREYLKANWQGPVARSINPKDDAAAARARVQNGTSSPQREAGQIGRDWREIVLENVEFIEFCKSEGLPDDIWQQALGIQQTDANTTEPLDTEPPEPTESEQDDAFEAAKSRMNGTAFSLN